MRKVTARLERQGVDQLVRDQLEAVCRCVGGIDILKATADLITNAESRHAIESLVQLWQELSRWKDRIIFDLTEIDEMEYYTGVMFAFFSPRLSSELGRGGRYDNLVQEFGRALPAVGFSFAVDGLAELL
jgi:ATP phosphoribosyltransferase regulatory subunit